VTAFQLLGAVAGLTAVAVGFVFGVLYEYYRVVRKLQYWDTRYYNQFRDYASRGENPGTVRIMDGQAQAAYTILDDIRTI